MPKLVTLQLDGDAIVVRLINGGLLLLFSRILDYLNFLFLYLLYLLFFFRLLLLFLLLRTFLLLLKLFLFLLTSIRCLVLLRHLLLYDLVHRRLQLYIQRLFLLILIR